jgi:cation transport regulator ChaC
VTGRSPAGGGRRSSAVTGGAGADDPVWIFGYGSLVWRPAFACEERRPALLPGWLRRFWQGSTDHRGVPGAPGRVVTLLPDAAPHCWGMAYRLARREAEAVMAELDHRERGGYERRRVSLRLQGEKAAAEGLVYVATPANANYLGPAPLDAIAQQVDGATGPSGHNREYVLRLAEAIREIGARDAHIFALEHRLLRFRG